MQPFLVFWICNINKWKFSPLGKYADTRIQRARINVPWPCTYPAEVRRPTRLPSLETAETEARRQNNHSPVALRRYATQRIRPLHLLPTPWDEAAAQDTQDGCAIVGKAATLTTRDGAGTEFARDGEPERKDSEGESDTWASRIWSEVYGEGYAEEIRYQRRWRTAGTTKEEKEVVKRGWPIRVISHDSLDNCCDWLVPFDCLCSCFQFPLYT